MTGRTIFLTYATDNFRVQRDGLSASASRHGFDTILALSPHDICDTNFWKDNQGILTQNRGAGYWLWKPFIIQRTLEQMSDRDVLLYCDAGRIPYYRFTRPPAALLRLARQKGFLTGASTPQHGPLRRWTKRDCLTIMDGDRQEVLERPMIQATWSVWTKTPAATHFVDQWLNYSIDPLCLTDTPNELGQPNHADFRDHRHDQSISSLLTYRQAAPYLDLSGTSFERLLRLRPQSALANLFLKRPQDGDSVAKGSFAPLTLAQAQWKIWTGNKN